jgi:hypothetical protein
MANLGAHAALLPAHFPPACAATTTAHSKPPNDDPGMKSERMQTGIIETLWGSASRSLAPTSEIFRYARPSRAAKGSRCRETSDTAAPQLARRTSFPGNSFFPYKLKNRCLFVKQTGFRELSFFSK